MAQEKEEQLQPQRTRGRSPSRSADVKQQQAPPESVAIGSSEVGSDVIQVPRFTRRRPEPPSLFARLSETSSRAITIANNLRQKIQHPDGDKIFTEMLLAGLNAVEGKEPQAVLAAFHLDGSRLFARRSEFRRGLESTHVEAATAELKDLSPTTLEDLPYSSNARRALDRADELARTKRTNKVRARHILTALLENDQCVASRWLAESGVPIEKVAEILRVAPEDKKVTPAMFGYAPGIASADLPAKKDTLGFDMPAQALAEIIIKKETVPPVVFGIYGPWGSGKSTFMYYVKNHLETWDKRQQALRTMRGRLSELVNRLLRRQPSQHPAGAAPQRDVPRIVCVCFDAWAYTDSAKLWAGLVRDISERLDETIQWWKRPVYWLRRTGWQFIGAVLLSLLPVIGGIVVALLVPLWDQARNLEIVRYLSTLIGTLLSAKLLGNQKPLSEIVRAELKNIDMSEVEGVINRIQKQLRTTVKDYFKLTEEEAPQPEDAPQQATTVIRQNKLKVVVFIDELDRCPLEKIVDILESIKLFLAEDIFIVLMAVDTRVAAEAIRLHYIDVKNSDLAREYLEKIIQVPIPVPIAGEERLSEYIEGLMSIKAEKREKREKQAGSLPPKQKASGVETPARRPVEVSDEPFKPLNLEDTEDEKITFLDFAKEYLESNPRRIKRLLNTYRYVKILAQRHGYQTDDALWQTRMIDWLGATMRWPLFMKEAAEEIVAGSAPNLWDSVRTRVDRKFHPPDEIVSRLPSADEVRELATLADNFIKENPPYVVPQEKQDGQAQQEKSGDTG